MTDSQLMGVIIGVWLIKWGVGMVVGLFGVSEMSFKKLGTIYRMYTMFILPQTPAENSGKP